MRAFFSEQTIEESIFIISTLTTYVIVASVCNGKIMLLVLKELSRKDEPDVSRRCRKMSNEKRLFSEKSKPVKISHFHPRKTMGLSAEDHYERPHA